MLLSILVGGVETDVTNEWGLTTDSYGNTFMSNESIRQRIRLGKKVDTKFDKVYSSSNASCYDFAKNTFLSNNNKNVKLYFY